MKKDTELMIIAIQAADKFLYEIDRWDDKRFDVRDPKGVALQAAKVVNARELYRAARCDLEEY